MSTMEKKIEVERNFIELRPTSKWSQSGDAYTLLIDLPDFQKEQIRISIDDPSNTLSIRCERPIPGDPWWRFTGDFPVPEECDINGMKAKYENGVLCLIFPKVIHEEEDEGQEDDEVEIMKKSKHEVGKKVQVVMGMNNSTKQLILNVFAALLVLLVLWMSLSHTMRNNNYLEVVEE
ncbi:Small heat shock protein HSP20 protein [Dioscorea alata]|uniref:Small heat shock protein HSP20 protein n=1 Tax=Dioscorea alata TaxID=55571 RepID=A0ACB7UME1_DIOAL|nr:Small heat shock protein HSP20 protein [Dioscorea alata]